MFDVAEYKSEAKQEFFLRAGNTNPRTFVPNAVE
jgi:hypothetical protein